MLKAMVASTGGWGTWTYPRVARVSVMLCDTVKAVTVFTSLQPPASDDEQREDEQ